jgi:hypothetical protein
MEDLYNAFHLLLKVLHHREVEIIMPVELLNTFAHVSYHAKLADVAHFHTAHWLSQLNYSLITTEQLGELVYTTYSIAYLVPGSNLQIFSPINGP